MDTPVVGHMDADKFEAMVEHFIEQRSGEDDRLPAQTFFELLAERETMTEPVEVRVTWSAETGPEISTSPDAPLTIEGHRIRFEDGHELVLRFDFGEQEPAPA